MEVVAPIPVAQVVCGTPQTITVHDILRDKPNILEEPEIIIIPDDPPKKKYKYPCPHTNTKWNCRICKGCPHGKLKHRCRECVNTIKISEYHNTQEISDDEIRGSASTLVSLGSKISDDISTTELVPSSTKERKSCEHQKQRSVCIICTPSKRCECGKRKDQCTKCNPELLCECGKRRYGCIKHFPRASCLHGKYKKNCPICYPEKILCNCGKWKTSCKKCNPSLICEHGSRKKTCEKCPHTPRKRKLDTVKSEK